MSSTGWGVQTTQRCTINHSVSTLESPQAPQRPLTALVTGGARRVGEAITLALLDAGYLVWVHHFSAQTRAAELAEHPGVLGAVRADLRDDAQRRALTQRIAEHGSLDLLVNNAAGFETGPFIQRDDDDLRRVLELNLIAPLSLVRQLLPVMPASASVINLLDLGASHPWPDRLDHCVSKAGLSMATRALAVELAPRRVNAIAPGTVALPTGMNEADEHRIAAKIPRGRIGQPSDVAAAVVFLASSPHISGETLTIDGGRAAGLAGPHA